MPILRIIILSFVIVGPGVVKAQQTLFIKGLSVPVRQGPGATATVQGQLRRGEQVVLLEEKDLWSKVKSEKEKVEGWVPQIMLSKNPISEKGSLLSTEEDISQKSRKRASSAATAGAARGLKEDTEQTLVKLKGANYQELKTLYQLHIPPRNVSRFIEL